MGRIIKLETIVGDDMPIVFIDVSAVQAVYEHSCFPELDAPRGSSWLAIQGGHRFNIPLPAERLAALVWGEDLPDFETT